MSELGSKILKVCIVIYLHKTADSGRQWRTEKSGMLQYIGLRKVRQDLFTEQQIVTDTLWFSKPKISDCVILYSKYLLTPAGSRVQCLLPPTDD